MKKFSKYALMAGLGLISLACARKEARLDVFGADEYNGSTAELITYEDSLILANAPVTNGAISFITTESDSVKYPMLAQLNIDGRTVAFYVIEPGNASLSLDSMSVASGTITNDAFSRMMASLDSAENIDMNAYTALAEKLYNENRNNVLGNYAAIEWLKFGDPSKVENLIKQLPSDLRNSKRVSKYIHYAELRAKTAPGQHFTDFEGEDADGNTIKFSSLVKPSHYTLVDFMASWCPYCIKDMKEIKALKEKYGDKGLEIVSVAVRDSPEDTRNAVQKHGISWSVLYNTGRRPYDIYGFSGIPHYMLIAPDGKIILRTETLSDVNNYLSSL